MIDLLRRPTVLATLAVGSLLGEPAMAQAQMPDAAETLDAVQTFREMIRWSGVTLAPLVIGLAWLLLRIVDDATSQLTEIFVARRMLLHKARAFFHFAVYLATTAVVILLCFNLSDRVLAVVGGTIAVGIGFGIKDLAASVIAGITIMVDQPFQVGDRVAFGDYYGDIVSIGLRSVRLRTLDDNLVTVPNNLLQSGIAASGNAGELHMMVVVDFHIGADQDVRAAREVAREAVVTSRYVYLEEPVRVLVTQVVIGDLVALRLRVKAYVLDTQYEKAFETDVTLRVLAAFDDLGVQPPALLHRAVAGSDTQLGPVTQASGERP